MKKEELSLATKQKLAAALKSLMAKKPFDKITVRELLQEADVTRPTFYYHFEDIYDLLVWTFNEETDALLKKCENCITLDEGIILALRYVEKERAVCLSAYNSIGRDTLERFLHKNAEEIMRRFIENLAGEIPAKPEHVQFVTEFYTDAIASVLVRWLRSPDGRTPEQLTELLIITMHGNIQAALERSAEGFTSADV